MEPEQFLKRKLKRLYDEINYAQQRSDYASVKGFLYWLSEAIVIAKTVYPENKWIKGITKTVPGYFDNPLSASANLTTIKLRLYDLMDSLEIDFEEIKKVQSFAPPIFNISQSQNSTQVNIQSLENIMSIANTLLIPSETKVEITELLDEYKKETEGGKSDETKIKSILSKIYQASKEVGIPLLNHALQGGYLSNLFNQ